MPTRLLDVGSLDQPQLRLHLTIPNSPQISYMTLSHCWGQLRIKRLELGTLRQMREKIDMHDLTRTFQDAIQFTRESGIKFLWIDSLCIIQDSPTDWEKESEMMRDVYKNAFCNITATAAPDGRSGCFFERDLVLSQSLRVEIGSGGAGPPILYDFIFRDEWKRSVVDAPLNRRAWVLQEKFLSPRTLHFARDQLFWECHELVRRVLGS